MPLYSWGFNAFHQTGDQDPTCNVKQVLFTSWETTIVCNDQGELVVWGYKPAFFDKVAAQCKKKQVRALFGHPNELVGLIDGTSGTVTLVTVATTRVDIGQADQVVYCSMLQSTFVLFAGTVHQYTKDTMHTLPLRNIRSMSGSDSHVLFAGDEVYGLGSNRLSQLGVDFDGKDVTKPTMIEYFCGLGKVTDMACGPFHSAVIVDGDVYTFGWHKDDRLGRDMEETIGLAMFFENEDSVEVNAVQVVCGSSHTVVLDDSGTVWTCGSNRYGQLGREERPGFRRCKTEKAKGIYAGQWTTFIFY